MAKGPFLVRLATLGALAVGLCVFGYGGFGLREALGQSVCQGPPEFLRGGGGVLGCGKGIDQCPTGPEGNGGGASIYRFSGTGIALSRFEVDTGFEALEIVDGAKDDAFVSTEGGQADIFPSGEASSICEFSTRDFTDIESNGIEIVTAASPDVPGACSDPARCIQCTTTSGQICTIECVGKIPQEDVADVDSFEITVTFFHSFNETQAGPPGMLRFDGFAEDWTEFLPDGELPDFVTTEGCNGGAPGEMVLNNSDFLDINDLVPESFWIQSFGIDDTSLGGACLIHTILHSHMPLAGVLDNSEVDVKRGPITLYGTICSRSGSAEDCPAPTR
ncbi:MAG TPA: hypothetical protein VFX30_10125 [bacterium]|nr:hypothetical protein [bacterium]